jgi:vanillate/4-hydroxybenzoate decarboxylase subunit D
MAHYPRPTELTVTAEREPVDNSCPRCGHEEVSRYPVLSEGGWFQVVKCQGCLHSLERTPWRNLGPIELLSDQI